MKNNCWLFEKLFKIQKNGAFLKKYSIAKSKAQCHNFEDVHENNFVPFYTQLYYITV